MSATCCAPAASPSAPDRPWVDQHCAAPPRSAATQKPGDKYCPVPLAEPGPGSFLRGTGKSRSFGDGVDLVGDEPVCLAVHRGGRIGVWRVDQAEDLAVLLVDPVAQVMDAVCVL